MAIVQLTAPAVPPVANADWENAVAIINALALQIEKPLRVVGSNVVKGSVFQIGGTAYIATSNTAISGTASNYVKLTPSGDGSTCSAAFVASLSGVAWSSTYNGYYDTGTPACLYVFDEAKAKIAGVIAGAATEAGDEVSAAVIAEAAERVAAYNANRDFMVAHFGGVYHKIVSGSGTFTSSDSYVSVAHGLDASKIRGISTVMIKNNIYRCTPSCDYEDSSATKHMFSTYFTTTDIKVHKMAGGSDLTGAVTVYFDVVYVD
jgi:hypothetical protein